MRSGTRRKRARDHVCDNAMEWGSEPELFGPRHRFRVGFMLSTLRRLLPRGRVLDAGCGVGSISLALSRWGYAVHGIDLSERFCQHVASTQLREVSTAEASIIRADIEKLPFRDDTFDGLVCGDVLEHVHDDGAALREFRRVLRPGGVFVITVPVREELWDETDEWAGHLRRYDWHEFCAMIGRAGLQVEKVEPYGFPFGQLYHRYVTRPLVADHGRRREAGSRFGAFKRYGRLPLVVSVLAAMLSVDRWLNFASLASGILIAGRASEAKG